MDVRSFADEFEANQVAAEHKYNDKIVVLTAPVSNIRNDGISFSNITTEFSLTQISCDIRDESHLVSLSKGGIVTVQGKVSGQMLGVIRLKDCDVM